jgi:hypothetical protein
MTNEQFNEEVKSWPDYLVLDGGIYGDGLRWIMVLDERDGAGHVAYCVPEDYFYRTEEERAKYESRDHHDIEEMYAELAAAAKRLGAKERKLRQPDMTRDLTGFDIEEAR